METDREEGCTAPGAAEQVLEAQAGLFEAMNWVDLAHTLVLTEAGIVPFEAAQTLLAARLKLHERPADFSPEPAKGIFSPTAKPGWPG